MSLFFNLLVLLYLIQWLYFVFSYNINFFLPMLATDHGIKAQGDGWLLTVALIEGSNLSAADSSGLADPYVIFTCNGKTKTSSTKFQKSDPLWNGEYYVGL